MWVSSLSLVLLSVSLQPVTRADYIPQFVFPLVTHEECVKGVSLSLTLTLALQSGTSFLLSALWSGTSFPLELKDTATLWSGEISVAPCSTPNPSSFSSLSLSHPRAGWPWEKQERRTPVVGNQGHPGKQTRWLSFKSILFKHLLRVYVE